LTKKKTRLKQKLMYKLGLTMSQRDHHALESLEEVASWHRDENNSHVKRSRFVQVQHQQFTQVRALYVISVVLDLCSFFVLLLNIFWSICSAPIFCRLTCISTTSCLAF